MIANTYVCKNVNVLFGKSSRGLSVDCDTLKKHIFSEVEIGSFTYACLCQPRADIDKLVCNNALVL